MCFWHILMRLLSLTLLKLLMVGFPVHSSSWRTMVAPTSSSMSGRSSFTFGCESGSCACPILMFGMLTSMVTTLGVRGTLAYKEWRRTNIEECEEVKTYSTQWMELIIAIRERSNILKLMLEMASELDKEVDEDKPSATGTLLDLSGWLLGCS